MSFWNPYHQCISMYGIYVHLVDFSIAMVNVGKYTMHGSYGGTFQIFWIYDRNSKKKLG